MSHSPCCHQLIWGFRKILLPWSCVAVCICFVTQGKVSVRQCWFKQRKVWVRLRSHKRGAGETVLAQEKGAKETAKSDGEQPPQWPQAFCTRSNLLANVSHMLWLSVCVCHKNVGSETTGLGFAAVVGHPVASPAAAIVWKPDQWQNLTQGPRCPCYGHVTPDVYGKCTKTRAHTNQKKHKCPAAVSTALH